MTETPHIICLPWEDAELAVPGSQIRWCGLCGTEISVSPDGIELIDAGVAKPVCTDCGIGLMDMDDEPEVATRIAGQSIPISGDAARMAMEFIRERRG